MNRLFTNQILRKKRGKSALKSFAILMLLFLFGSTASAQYSTPGHYYGCFWNNGNLGSASIEEIIIEDGAGNQVFRKAADDCNDRTTNALNVAGAHYNLVTTSSSFTLVAGGEYTIKISTSMRQNFITDQNVGIWADVNGNQSFGDAGEYLGQVRTRPGAGLANPGTLGVATFTVPCGGFSGTSRIRFRSDRQQNWSAGLHSNAGGATQFGYGETEDYTITIANPSSISSNFSIPDTAFVGTRVTAINGTGGNFRSTWTFTEGGSDYIYNMPNGRHVFTTTGRHQIKLVNENCFGADSTTRAIVIVQPPAPPVVDFVASDVIVDLFDEIQLTDLSSNGPTYWNWLFVKGTDTVDGGFLFELRGNDLDVNQNPRALAAFIGTGLWDVCLQASNSRGASALRCKKEYVNITKLTYNMGPETSLPFNVIEALSGMIFDKGGPDNPYVANDEVEALIAPCGAESVTLEFKQWKVMTNATLRIFDGENATGTLLATLTSTTPPTGPITANSGQMYLSFRSTIGAVDSGFAAEWTSVTGAATPPAADFTVPAGDIFNGSLTTFNNTSTSVRGKVEYVWSVEPITAGQPEQEVSFAENLNFQFVSNNVNRVCLEVETCQGKDKTCKDVTVRAANVKTDIDFVADDRRPSANGVVELTAITNNANIFEWSIFPGTADDIEFIGGNNGQKVRNVRFKKPGAYAVQLRAYNLVDEAGSVNNLIRARYIIVTDYCDPIVGVTTTPDVGISRVMLQDDNSSDVMFNNRSTSGLVPYQSFMEMGVYELNYGAKYNFEVERNTSVNTANRKIWIDWNADGRFDASEMVASEATGTDLTWKGSFNVPNSDNAFPANTRMRVAISYGNDRNEPCGFASAASANRVGEFEDYAVRVVNDGDQPVITLINDDTLYIERHPTNVYTDPGAIAMDPSQGDISSEIVVGGLDDIDLAFPNYYYVTFNVKDASGNAADQVTRVIKVVLDQTPPTLTLNPRIVDTIEVGGVWVDPGSSAIDMPGGENLTGAIVVTGSVNPNVIGLYEVNYSVSDAQGNVSNAVRTVLVRDTELPVIINANADQSNPSIWEVEVQLQSVFVDVTTATDNYNSLMDNLILTATPGFGREALVDTRFQGATLVTYEATDESGNAITQQVRYVVRDFIPPMITLHTADTIDHDFGKPYNRVQASVTDNLSNASELSMTLNSNVDVFKLGTYTDTYTATDAAGNTSVRNRFIRVVDREVPQIFGKDGAILTVGYLSVFSVTDRLVFSDNETSPQVLKDNAVEIFNNLNVYNRGLYSIILQTTDNSGNVSDPFTLLVRVDPDHFRLGVDNLEVEKGMKVYPNPTTGIFNVKVDIPANETIQVGVYDAAGSELQNVVSNTMNQGHYEVNLNGYAAGVYLVRMQIQDQIITKKVILNK